jgi:hypothetical protein
MRAFGEVVDLDVDFGQPDRPGLVTALLTQCGNRRDAEFWWSQPVGRRIAALLELVALTEQRDAISLTAPCVAAACGESFEFELRLRSLPRGTAEVGPLRVQLEGERALTMRRPTGDDLRRWRDAKPGSRDEALRLMLDSLVITGQPRSDDEAAVSASIATMDPLVDFTVSCQCPACGALSEVAIDLEAVALARLVSRQRALLQEVHWFALHYGWTESEVLAIPQARRARYLALIADQQ